MRHPYCEISHTLNGGTAARANAVESLVRKLRPGRPLHGRSVRRYDFDDPHIRFCPHCCPVNGDEIIGAPEGGRLNVHRKVCPKAGFAANVVLSWNASPGFRYTLQRSTEPLLLTAGWADDPAASGLPGR